MASSILMFICLLVITMVEKGVCNDLREICVGEETALNCDQLDHATKNHSYLELVWIVTDLKNPGDTKLISYCGKDPNNCSLLSSLNESCFAQRIQVRTLSRGSIFVRQLWKNDALSFSCRLFLQGDKRPLITSVNHLTVTCLSLSTGQDVNLSQASGENRISSETVKDKWWYILQGNGGEKKMAYCNGTKCSSILCSEYKTRMEINGLSLILKKVQLADEGLRVQCKIWRKNHAAPLLFNVLLKLVSANPRTDAKKSTLDIPTKTSTGNNASRTDWQRITCIVFIISICFHIHFE